MIKSFLVMASKSSPYFLPKRKCTISAIESKLSQRKTRRKKIEIKYEDQIHENSNKQKDLCDSWQPQNWEVLLNNIKQMRIDRTATVDSKGCERTADSWELPSVIRYQTLVSLMLSSQTKDEMTFAAMSRLKKHGLNISNVIDTSEEMIGKLIKPVGFWKRKAKYIKEASQICHDDFHSDIPDTVKGLISLPGVGPKMAYICMTAAWGVVEGIGVDTHVHRIANRLHWVKKPTKNPENTRKELETWLPRSEWKDINILLVGFGQQTCLPVGPKCNTCLNKDICPSAKK